MGLRVRLGQVPGPLHRQVHSFHQEVPRKESPSHQRHCARRAAARQASVDRATDTEAVEANKVVQQTTEVHAVEVNADQVIDEFCSHAYYIENILSDENSVSYIFIV